MPAKHNSYSRGKVNKDGLLNAIDAELSRQGFFFSRKKVYFGLCFQRRVQNGGVQNMEVGGRTQN